MFAISINIIDSSSYMKFKKIICHSEILLNSSDVLQKDILLHRA